MKLISFDVGIKNMAYCIIDCSQSIQIIDWNIINLLDAETPISYCSCMLKPKNKKTSPSKCTKIAKYQKEGNYFCEKHAKENAQFLIPKKPFSASEIKKLKIDDLIKLGNSHLAFVDSENPSSWKRVVLVDFLSKFFANKCFEPIHIIKSKTASETDLIKIGRNMKTQMDGVNKSGLTNAVIENQISPIANRMKTVQGMLTQYFIMTIPEMNIDFVSSANKLKQFETPKPKQKIADQSANDDKRVNPDYKQHKKDGVFYCNKILEINPSLETWKGSLNIKKKDDLADSFLQGVWYLKHNNIITFADDLKINIVGLS